MSNARKILAGMTLAAVMLYADGLQLTGSLRALAQGGNGGDGGSRGTGSRLADSSDSLDGTSVSSPDFHRLNEIPGMLVSGAYHAVMDAIVGTGTADTPSDTPFANNGAIGSVNDGGGRGSIGNSGDVNGAHGTDQGVG